jgi:YD repeat-containing protein
MKQRIALTVMLLTIGGALLAQPSLYNTVSVATPGAASLGKYADVPVNHHTGIPQISIPVYKVEDGPIALPVSLSYHASGLKVGEPASWVGAGWSLNLSGVISRTVQGAPDERYTSSSNAEQSKGYLSDGGYPNYLWHRENPNNSNEYTNLLKDFYQGYADGEPDLFFFNFGGHSGKFYFGDDKVPVLLPEQDMKIEYDYTPGLHKSIERFILTTPDGTRWHFGTTPQAGDTDPVERTLAYSQNNGYGHDGRSISAWYLYKVVSANGNHTITLSYEAEKYSYYNIASNPVAYDLVAVNGQTPTWIDGNGHGSHLNKVIVEGVRLRQVDFTDGKVELVPGALREDLSGPLLTLTDHPNEQAKPLAEIKITGKDGACRKLVLAYGYFADSENKGAVEGAGSVNSDKKKLKLLQVQEQSCDGSMVLPPYTFDYHAENVPRSLSFSQDHWGFHNGADNNMLIPTFTENQFEEVPGADRDSHWPAMRGGTLNKITYPTGGYTEFEYEPNKAWVSYHRYNREYRFSTAVGYDNNNSSTSYQLFSSNPYKIKLTNSACAYPATSCLASVQITDQNSNALVFSLTAEGGQQKTGYVTLPAGTYKITIYKNAAGQGSMASAEFTEMVPVLYEANETVGGLRIKAIRQSEQARPGTVIKTDYTYEVNGRTTGVLYSRPTYVQVLKNSGARYAFTQLQVQGATWRFDNEEPMPNEWPYFSFPARKAWKSAAPILPMSTTQGNHIGYSEVKVAKTGNGHSIYRYYGSNIWDNDHSDVALRKIDRSSANPAAPEYPAAPLPFDYKRGELKYEGHFSEAGKLLKEAIYTLTYQVQPVTTPGFRVYAEPRGAGTWVSAKTDFELQSEKKVSTEVVENTYDQVTNDYKQTVTTTLYESPYHSAATSVSTINAKGQTVVARTKYAPDFTLAHCNAADNCWASYQTALTAAGNAYAAADAACTTSDCRMAAKAQYNWEKMQARRNYSQCRIDRLALKAACYTSSLATADAELKPILALQQDYRIMPIEQTSWKNGLLTGALFNRFGYDLSNNGLVNLQKVQKIFLQVPSTSFEPAANNGNGLAKDSRYADEESYRFKNGVLYDAEKPGKVYSAYLWDYGHTKPVAVAANTLADHIAFTSFETTNGGGFVYNETATVADATAPTGKRAFALSPANNISRLVNATLPFTVSCWAQGPVTVNGGTPLRTGRSLNGWTYYEWDVANTAQVTLNGNTLVDELRLYPKQAQMTTYTYDLLTGITSQSDAAGNITYYEYDALNRLKYVKDSDRKVLKVMEYGYKRPLGE